MSNHVAEAWSRKSNAQMANQIVRHFLRKWNASHEDDELGRYAQLLVAYLNQNTKAKLDVWEEEEEEKEEEDDDLDDLDDEKSGWDKNENRKAKRREGTDDPEDRGFTCVICELRYKSRSTLTGHYEKHRRNGFFEQPLWCPECCRNKKSASVGRGYLTWLNHLERFYGQRYTPYFRQTEKYPEKYPCPFLNCDVQRKGKPYNSRGLTGHFARVHVNEQDANVQGKFKDAIQCHRCISQKVGGGTAPLIASLRDWRRHIDLVHCRDQHRMYQCLLCLEMVRTARGLKSHFYSLHERRESFFANPFRCPECIRAGQDDAPEIMGRKAWQEHNDQHHDGGAKKEPLATGLQSPQRHPRYPYLICLNCYHMRDTLARHLDRGRGELFQTPFRCPKCAREHGRDTELFENKHTWILHVLQEHPADGTNSGTNLDTCFDTSDPDASEMPTGLASRGSRRKRVQELGAEMGSQRRRPEPPQHCRSSTVSTTGCGGRSGTWDISSEEGFASDMPDSDLDGIAVAHLNRGGKREMAERDLQPSAEGSGRQPQQPHHSPTTRSNASQSTVDLEYIPIDPCLLGLK